MPVFILQFRGLDNFNLQLDGCYRQWTDDSGQQRFGVEIIAHDVLFLDRRPDAVPADAGAPEADHALDLPF